MAELTAGAMGALLRPYVVDCTEGILRKLGVYLELLLKWNARTNLTAIRDPEEIVRRHFGESLFAARHLGDPATLLDYGSGAGFPGIPIALLRPEMRVTVAESQGKKAAFLRELVRALEISVEVWGGRAETFPGGAFFDCVTLRSVDGMSSAVASAALLADRELVLLTTVPASGGIVVPDGFEVLGQIVVPESRERVLLRYSRVRARDVPRGT